MVKRNLALIALILLLIALVFFGQRVFLQAKQFLFSVVLDAEENNNDGEIFALKAELAKLENIKNELPEKPWNYTRALVLSRYPMNFKNEILVNSGSNDRVFAGQAVALFNVLVGKVDKVFDDASLVQTVFDSRFRLPVRIGRSGADGLLLGGALPTVTLIPREEKITKGDIVYSASPDFPYGMAVGEVEKIALSSDELFMEAVLRFSYNLSSVKSVFLVGK